MNSNFWGYKDKLEESLRELNFKGDILFVRNEEGVFMIRYSDNRVRQAGAFDYYLRTAFERASALGLADDPELAKLREEYRIEHERVSHILTLEELAA